MNKPRPVILYELVKGWLTGTEPELGEMHAIKGSAVAAGELLGSGSCSCSAPPGAPGRTPAAPMRSAATHTCRLDREEHSRWSS